jgi:hypothetical protein
MTARRKQLVWAAAVTAAVLVLLLFTAAATSTRWFCTSACHNALADAVQANTRSAHSQVNCASCHLPSLRNPVSWAIHKTEGLGDVVSEIKGNYELPLNKESTLAFSMPSDRCTGCHSQPLYTLKVGDGFRINHQRHVDRGVGCTICHNRTGHVEKDFKLTLLDEKLKASNFKHADFMKMTACFRCHTQESVKGAPTGNCMACHTPSFTLKPEDHSGPLFATKGHAQMASKQESVAPWFTATSDPVMKTIVTTTGVTKWSAENLSALRKTGQVNECSTCHAKKFCSDCHVVPMPHPVTLFEKTHATLSERFGQSCVKCHTSGEAFCSECHHAARFGVDLDTRSGWKEQHRKVAERVGKNRCTRIGGCHSPVYCAKCHVNDGELPSDAPRW